MLLYMDIITLCNEIKHNITKFEKEDIMNNYKNIILYIKKINRNKNKR